jgi:hypothetical protein
MGGGNLTAVVRAGVREAKGRPPLSKLSPTQGRAWNCMRMSLPEPLREMERGSELWETLKGNVMV